MNNVPAFEVCNLFHLNNKGSGCCYWRFFKIYYNFWIIKRKPFKWKNIHIIYSPWIRWTNQIQWKLFFPLSSNPLGNVLVFLLFFFSRKIFLKPKLKYNYVIIFLSFHSSNLSHVLLPNSWPLFLWLFLHICAYTYICIYIPKNINITSLSHIMSCLYIEFHDWPLDFIQQ